MQQFCCDYFEDSLRFHGPTLEDCTRKCHVVDNEPCLAQAIDMMWNGVFENEVFDAPLEESDASFVVYDEESPTELYKVKNLHA